MNKKCYITAFLVIFAYACQKQSIFDDEPVNPPLTVDEAKKWYESNFTEVKLSKQKTNYSSKVVNSLLWDMAITSQKGDISAVEVPISSNLERTYRCGSVPEGGPNSFPGLVIRRNMNSGKYQCRVMTVICDSAYMLLPDFESRMSRNRTFSLDEEFSGMIHFSMVNGRFTGGCRYADGKCIGTIRDRKSVV